MFDDMKEMWDWKATVAAIVLVVIIAVSFLASEWVGWIVLVGIVIMLVVGRYNQMIENREVEYRMRLEREITRKLDRKRDAEEERRQARKVDD